VTLAESDQERPARLRRWLREPIVHFVAIGLLLFVGYRLLHPDAGAQPGRIVLTEDDLRQISVAWLAQGRPPLTPEQMKSLIEGKVREEILYREALALGLEKDDTIVKRRLAQKMEFLADDVAALREPSSAELRDWFGKNSARFAMSPRTSFRHVYFSLDRGGERAHDAAAKALPRLSGKRGDWSGAATLGDPFMFQDYYADRSFEQLASVFGPGFAREVAELKPGAWRGPIESGYGWHLVWIESITPGRVPPFEEIEPDVKAEWTAEQREETKRKAFEAMRARYEVVLPAPPGNVAGGAAPTRKSLP
jgi:peptidyl-prolyl cis-trans isomerase C